MIKKIFIIAAIFFIITIGVGWYFLYRSPATENPGSVGPDGTYSPFGTPGASRTPAVGDGSNTGTGAGDGSTTIFIGKAPSALVRITNVPASGATFVATTSTLRYIERATGHISDADLVSGKVTRISNTTIPKIYESVFLNSGKNVILRYLADDEETIITYSGSIKNGSSTTATLQGTFLDQNIDSLSISPDEKKIFLLENSGSGATAYTINIDGTKRASAWNSPVGEWLTNWPTASNVVLTTKPSSSVDGFMYSLDLKTGLTKKILGGIRGLTGSVDPSNSYILYSDAFTTLSIKNLKTGTDTKLPIETLGDKCVWSKKEKGIAYCAVATVMPVGTFPDDWYKGLISLNDAIYRVDAVSGRSSLISDLTKDYKTNIDVINPALSSKEDYLVFMNNKDLTLWSLKLPQIATSTATSTR